MKNLVLASICCLLWFFPVFSQESGKTEKVRPFRVGVKIGVPNLVGGNLEYVSPLFGNKLALSLDYSNFKSEWFEPEDQNDGDQSGSYNFDYLEGGLNYYFFKPGKGLYAGISYGMIGIDGTEYNLRSNDDTNSSGVSRIDYTNNSFNVKLGAKLGGLFYFRPEIGYMFSPPPQTITIEVEFDDGRREFQDFSFNTDGITDLFFSGFIANIGIGFAF